METFKGLIINIVAAFLYFLLALLVAYIYRKLHTWLQMRLMSPLQYDKPLVAVLSTREGPLVHSTLRVSFAEIEALINLKATLENKQFELLSGNDDLNQFGNWNIILLGGPIANTASSTALKTLEKNIPFIFDEAERCIKVANRSYAPTYSDNGMVLVDYGVIIKTQNVFADSMAIATKLFMFMGLHGYGTKGSVKAILNKSISKTIWRKVKNSDFAAIIRVEISQSKKLDVFLEEAWQL